MRPISTSVRVPGGLTLARTSLLSALAILALGCRSYRVLRVASDPPGAVVRFDEELIGTTPLEHKFIHGGQRRVSVYLDGYRTWSRRIDVRGPWYSRFPYDLVTEVMVPMGLDYKFDVFVNLVVDTVEEQTQAPAVDAYVQRAMDLRAAEQEIADREAQESSGKDSQQ
jgi:PEGA domain